MKTKRLPHLAVLSVAAIGILMSNATAATESITLTLPPGFSLLANHLDHGDNTLNTVLPGVPVESQVLKFANNNYVAAIFDGTTWLDAATGNPSSLTVSPGEGFFFFNPTLMDMVATFTGEVRQGPQTICFLPGYTLVGSPVPEPFSPNAASGFPRILEMQILRYIRAGQPGGPGYRLIICDGFTWIDSETGLPSNETIPVGEGFFVFNPSPASICWTRSFSLE